MKKLLFLTAVSALFFTFCSAQPSPKASAEGKGVSVTYSAPSKKGREIFGGLVPYGQVWRTGANNATEITFAADTKFGGKDIKAGTYSLFTIPGEKEWTVILNSELKQWGSFGYEKIKSKDVLKVTATPVKTKEVVEQFKIRFDGSNNLILEWDTTQVSVKVG